MTGLWRIHGSECRVWLSNCSTRWARYAKRSGCAVLGGIAGLLDGPWVLLGALGWRLELFSGCQFGLEIVAKYRINYNVPRLDSEPVIGGQQTALLSFPGLVHSHTLDAAHVTGFFSTAMCHVVLDRCFQR